MAAKVHINQSCWKAIVTIAIVFVIVIGIVTVIAITMVIVITMVIIIAIVIVTVIVLPNNQSINNAMLPGPATVPFLPSSPSPLNGEPFFISFINTTRNIITIMIKTSILTILTMTRYLAICHPLYSYTMAGLKRTARLILINN